MPVETAEAALLDREVGEDYLRLLGDGDEFGAVAQVVGLLDAGVPPARIMLDLIAPAQARIGELWAANTWSIAREHVATAISERALAAVATRTHVRPVRGRVAVACVDGEWHALPVRILAEVLRLDGWRVDFLGANVPGPHLVTHLHQTGPDAVALSCMLPTRLARAHVAITACRAAGVPVIAGGRGFGVDGRHALTLGADAWAAGAEDAARRLAHGWPPATGGDDLRHLGDEEYTHLCRSRPQLIAAAVERLAAAYPRLAGADGRARDATIDDLGHVVDFLAAALYVDDPTVFTDFVVWTSQVLEARSVPPASLTFGLEVCRDRMPDYPRTRALLDAGLRELRGRAGR
jgi:methanogenic corrinoid protein MtbC1